MESRCRSMISSGVGKRGIGKEWRWHRECELFAVGVVVVSMHDRFSRVVIRHSRRLGYLARMYHALPQKAHARQAMQVRTCTERPVRMCLALLSLNPRIIRKSGKGSLKQTSFGL